MTDKDIINEISNIIQEFDKYEAIMKSIPDHIGIIIDLIVHKRYKIPTATTRIGCMLAVGGATWRTTKSNRSCYL